MIQSDFQWNYFLTSLFCFVSDYSRGLFLMFSVLVRKKPTPRGPFCCPSRSKGREKIIKKREKEIIF